MKKIIEKGQKVGYWTIFTNILLVLVTFWLGLVVQDIVASKNANVSAVLAKVEYTNKVKPSIDTLNVKYKAFIDEIIEGDSVDRNYISPLYVNKDELMKNNSILIRYYDDLLSTANKVIYFFEDSDLDQSSNISLISKIGDLFDYRELIDYCKNDSNYCLQKENFSQFEQEGCLLDIKYYKKAFRSRLNKLYNSPEYISIMGVNATQQSPIDINQVFDSLYVDLKSKRNDTEFELMSRSFCLAQSIHNSLNDKLIYRQPQSSVMNALLNAPWGPFLIISVIVWLLVTLMVFRSADKKNEINNDQKQISLLTNNLGELKVQLEDTKSKILELEEAIKGEKANKESEDEA